MSGLLHSSASQSEPKPARFRLRTMFYVVAIAAALSEIGRVMAGEESPFLVGLIAFSYGGFVALGSFVVTAMMFLAATRSAGAQHVGGIVASIACAGIWLAAVIFFTFQWLPICVVYCTIVLVLVAFMIRGVCTVQIGSSPEATLKRLLRTKEQVISRIDRQTSR